MKDLNEKCLRFVLHYYQKNKLNTQKALHVFKERNQFTDKPKKKSPFLWIASGAVAAILLFIAIYTWRNTENGWTEIVAYTYPVGYRLPDGSSVTLASETRSADKRKRILLGPTQSFTPVYGKRQSISN